MLISFNHHTSIGMIVFVAIVIAIIITNASVISDAQASEIV